MCTTRSCIHTRHAPLSCQVVEPPRHLRRFNVCSQHILERFSERNQNGAGNFKNSGGWLVTGVAVFYLRGGGQQRHPSRSYSNCKENISFLLLNTSRKALGMLCHGISPGQRDMRGGTFVRRADQPPRAHHVCGDSIVAAPILSFLTAGLSVRFGIIPLQI